MARQKITFEKRVQVLIDRDEAKEVDSNSGQTEYMRVCNGDTHIMFCPSALEAAIQASGAKAGDLISIDRLQVKRGRTTETVWEVAIISEPPAAPAPTPRSQPAQRELHRELRTQPAAAPPMPHTQPLPPVAPDTAQQAAAMASAFRAAILATGDAEQHAAALGIRDLGLSSADIITRVALSIYIQGGRA